MKNEEMKSSFQPDHWADLQKSGLGEGTIQRAGIYSVRPCDIPRLLGFDPPQVESALAFPYPGNGFVRLKVFPPYVDRDGHKVKYLQKKGSGVHLYIPPGIEAMLHDPNVPFFLTEGEKKGLKAAQEGLCCVGIGGIWNWKESGKDGLIPEIKTVPLLDRQVFLVPDSDFIQNPKVLHAVYCLGIELEKLGAKVEIICVPESISEDKVGLDDYLVSHSVEEFRDLKTISLEHPVFKKSSKKSGKHQLNESLSLLGKSPKVDIREIATNRDIKSFDKKRMIAELIQNFLVKSGTLYRTIEGRCFYFEESERRLYELEQRSFAQLVTDTFGLSSTEDFFRFALDTLVSNIVRHGQLAEVNTLAVYDAKKNQLAISDGASGIWIYSDGKWEHADNGKNGFVFLTETAAQHWTPDFTVEGKGLEWLFDRLNFAGSLQQIFDQKEIFKVWLMSLFFKGILHTKPIPTFLGPQGSGKTTFCRIIGRLLLGSQFNVSGLRPDKEDAFIASITNRILYAADNADSRVKWLEDALARYATGETFRMRRLYTTNEEVSYKATAVLMLTSRDPHFRRADVAERLLPFHLFRLEHFQDEESFFSDLYGMRPLILGDLLRMAGDIVEAIKTTQSPKLPFRMADFASFGWRIYKHKGMENTWIEILERLEKSQADFASEGDSMIETIRKVYEEGIEGPVLTGDLYQKCKVVAEADALPFPRTPQSFGKRFWDLQRVIELELGVKIISNPGHDRKIEITFKKVADSPSPPSPPSSMNDRGDAGDDEKGKF